MVSFNASAKPEARQKAVAKLIAELNADRSPIIAGPWRSEVGFEHLYWSPFLQFLAKHVKDFDKRAAVVTRGGLAPLYQSVASQGFDLYALRSVKEVRRENTYDLKVRNKGKTVKQLQMTDWDEAVLEDAAKALDLGPVYHTVHPAWMYWALAPFWDAQAGIKYLASLTDYTKLPRVSLDHMPGLPQKFVAVKCYARATFPYPHPQVSEWVQRTVQTIAAQCPVVLLNTGSEHDDHVDIPITGHNVYVLPQDLAPEQNLLVQAAVLSHATAFVGTYGGVAQLALRLGIPSVSVWLEWGGTMAAHHDLSWWLSKASKTPFLTGSIADCGLWQQILSLPAAKAEAA